MTMTSQESKLFQKSMEIANDIFSKSRLIRDSGADSSIYVNRVEYLENLLGDNGYINFNPMVEKDLSVDFRNSFKQRDDRMPLYASDVVDTDNERRLTRHVFESIKSEDLLSNTIPQGLKDTIEYFELKKKYSSPKLSSLLVKLWGEKSDVVRWYTTQCPKKLEKGVYDDYKITLSVLPHHIVGMSYYSPVNHGGDRWIDGWEGSSCMDTVRNSTGGNITKLIPNLLDSYLAVAYLSKTDGYDIKNPIYLARTLVRVTKIKDDQWVMLGLRTYSISKEAKDVLSEGLKNQYDNFVDVRYLRDFYRGERNVRYRNDCNVVMNLEQKYECGRCDGDGTYDDETCGRCDGTGSISQSDTLTPYVDDEDYVEVDENNGSMLIKLPKKWLEDKGYREPAPVTPVVVEEPKKNIFGFYSTPHFIHENIRVLADADNEEVGVF